MVRVGDFIPVATSISGSPRKRRPLKSALNQARPETVTLTQTYNEPEQVVLPPVLHFARSAVCISSDSLDCCCCWTCSQALRCASITSSRFEQAILVVQQHTVTHTESNCDSTLAQASGVNAAGGPTKIRQRPRDRFIVQSD